MDEAPNQHLELPPDFAALPEPEQRGILDAGEHLGKLAFRHATAINVSAPPSVDGPLKNGSGFVVNVNGSPYLGTAWHVVKFWIDKTAEGEERLFQPGNALIDPSERIAWKDEANDLVLLRVTDDEVSDIGVSVFEALPEWPPEHPTKGEYVLVAGYPEIVRQRLDQKRVQFNSLSALLQVTEVGDHHIVCQFLREHWVSYNPRGVPPPGTNLEGISGGPVLSVGQLAYPLIGAVSEFNSSFELLRVNTLSHAAETL